MDRMGICAGQENLRGFKNDNNFKENEFGNKE